MVAVIPNSVHPKFWYIVWVMFLIPAMSAAQNNSVPALERQVTLSINNQPVEEILTAISAQTGVVFSYNPDVISNKGKSSIRIKQKPVRYALNLIFSGSVKYKVKGKYIILQKNNPVLESNNGSAKTRTVEGYISEIKSGQRLSEVTVYGKDHLVSTITNQYGYFKLELPAEQANTTLRISKQGYTDTLLASFKEKDDYVDVELSSKANDTLNKVSIASSDSGLTARSGFLHWLISKNIWINSRNITDTVFRKVQFSFLPFISTNKLLTGSVENNVSFNIIAGYVQEVHTAEFGGVFNIVRYNAGICQLAGVGNIVGRTSRGFQGAGVLNYAKNVHGVQSAGVINMALNDVSMGQFGGVMSIAGGTVHGIQASGVVNYSRNMNGVQAGGVLNVVLNDSRICQVAGVANFAGGTSYGFQGAGVMNATRYLKGIQMAGVLNIALNDVRKSKQDKDSLVQPAGIINDTINVKEAKLLGKLNAVTSKAGVCQVAGVGNIFGGSIEGVQAAGVFNVARNVSGIQVASILNISQSVKGIQLALFNFSDSCNGVPIGLVSFVKHGYHKLEFSADEIFYTAYFRTGAKGFHNIFSISGRPGNFDNPIWAIGYGIGTTLGKLSHKMLFDIDLSSQHLYKGSLINSNNTIYKLYLGLDRKIGSKTSIALGITYNFFMSQVTDPNYNILSSIVPYSLSNHTASDGINRKSWLGGRAAIRFF